MENYLQSTPFLDFDQIEWLPFSIDESKTTKELAVELYFKVRDHFLYDPYHLDLRLDALKASNILKKRRAWCVEKAIVFATLARKYGIPSRLGYAIVTNHIGVDKLTAILKRNEIVFHGYVEVYIGDRWVKCTPAFDQRICSLSGVEPLDWNGEEDSLFQAFSGGQRFMEYLHDYGTFNDVPLLKMNQEMKKYYPHLFENIYEERSFSFRHLPNEQLV